MPGAEARVSKETKPNYILIDWVFPGIKRYTIRNLGVPRWVGTSLHLLVYSR